MEPDDGVVASALEVLEIAEFAALWNDDREVERLFTEAERAYARSKSDPERRLAARLAAKRAAARLLGHIGPEDIEVLRSRGGPPQLRLSKRAKERLVALGAARTLVSLAHGRTHAAAAVLLLRDRS